MNAANNTLLHEYSYDAWGRMRNTANLTNYSPGSEPVLFVAGRGFTGHEHLPWFNLINMNGRLYDPLTAQFLSPDNYVQLPDFTQNFNRYSYCLNNPLKYTDPSGELVWFVPVIAGAVIGSYLGGAIASDNWNPVSKQYWQDGWKGAIVGGLLGATAGAMFSAAMAPTALGSASGFHTTGMVVGGKATAGWGIATSSLQSASINIGLSFAQGQGLDGAWKAGLVGAASGAWTATGGLGLANKGLAGKLGYQMIGTSGRSIGNNWAAGEDPFSRVVVGAGPVNLTFGKGQKLLQWQNNLGNIAFNTVGLANLAAGGKMGFDWENLSPKYSGGFIDKALSSMGIEATGAHVVLSQNKLSRGQLLTHELRHVWLSRSMGDMFILNYFTQGIFPMLMGRDQYYGNYFEYTAEYGF
ncbi:MAG: RHS repeat-associated core domain-containing protein [Bacteroidales bacterium]